MKMKQTRAAAAATLAITLTCSSAVYCQGTTANPYPPYIAAAKKQIDQAKISIEQLRLSQAESRANRQEAAAKAKDPEIMKYQNLITLKQQEMSMYQAQESLEKQPFSTDQNIAALQRIIRQLTYEKGQLLLKQTQATQSGNKAQADQFAREANTKQLTITAKLQEIKLIEMKAKVTQ